MPAVSSFKSLGAVVCYSVEARIARTVPLMAALAECGFPSPADDYLDKPLDFNELLIANAPATFVVRIAGDSMTGIGIFAGDLGVVNRAGRVADGTVVLALVDGEFTIKNYRKRGGRVWLQGANPLYRDIEILEGMSFEVWGVVTHTIRTHG